MDSVPETFASLLSRKLEAAKKSPEDLAGSLDLSVAYVEAILDGTVPPPHPSRSDVYDRMTRCVKAGRRELAIAAEAERANLPTGTPPAPVVKALMALCDPATAETLRDRRHRALMHDVMQRLLDLLQASVSRMLSDSVGVRATARRRGISYAEQRELILRFLDMTAGTVSVAQIAEFIVPRVATWDVDLETGVLRLVMRGQEADDVHRRRPPTRRAV